MFSRLQNADRRIRAQPDAHRTSLKMFILYLFHGFMDCLVLVFVLTAARRGVKLQVKPLRAIFAETDAT